jgi:ABC-type transport system involved in multi-copper enzyme maturation permease subunit
MNARFRVRQAWVIARIELRRAFFSKRAFWVWGLALFPSLVFLGNGIAYKMRRSWLSARGVTPAALIDSVREGETVEAVLQRFGPPARQYEWTEEKRLTNKPVDTRVTTHVIDAVEARFIRLNIMRPTYFGDPTARIYELEVYGTGAENLALRRPALGSMPCTPEQGAEKAFNGSISGGENDKWCSHERKAFLQVDLGAPVAVNRFVVKHASAGGEGPESDTAAFSIEASKDGKVFAGVVYAMGGPRFMVERVARRHLVYFDGRRQAQLQFEDGALRSRDVQMLLNFEQDRSVFAGIFQYFYLRLALFFGCLGIFMNLFRGEMLDRTLHFWLLAPARRDVLLAGKYAAGLIAAAVIFTGGALLCFALMLWPHDPVEVQTYWQTAGLAHAFWYATAALLGCIGYGSVFLAAGLLLRNPIIPAAAALAWESINGFLPEILQRMSILYYLQSLCPVPAPTDRGFPPLVQLLLSPAAPASRAGAIFGLLALTAVVLYVARIAIRRMQISYGAET